MTTNTGGRSTMRMATRLRRLAVALFALMVALSQAPLSALATNMGTDTFRTILGNAVNYGIVAESFALESGDAQTNVAAKVATSKTQTGNDLTNDVEQPFVLASIADVFRIKGNDAYVQTNADDASKVEGLGSTAIALDTSKTQEQLEERVDALLGHVDAYSHLLASRDQTAEVIYDHPSQKYVLDLRDREAGTYYATLNAMTYEAISREPSKLKIHKADDQTIVFNVLADAQTLNKFDLNGRGADAYLGKDAGYAPQTIVWNFPQATSLNIAGSVTGVILAPKATVTVSATSSGWLVAKSVIIGSGEWHNVFQGVVPRPDAPSVEPEDPETPDNPEDPETPDAPSTPDMPGTPSDPEDPQGPENPSEPGGPIMPEAEPRIVIRATKTSLENPSEVLAGAVYGLWLDNEDEADERLLSAESDADGMLQFELPSSDDNTYYLLEEEAPFGHLVDPYRTDSFAIGYDDEGFYLQHEGDDKLVRAAAETLDGTLVFDYEPTLNPVSDHATQVAVTKLDRSTGRPLAGARLRIVDDETGEVMAEWTSDEDAHELVSVLDSERTYVLSEVDTPQGYTQADDVTFTIHEEGTHTQGMLMSGATDSGGNTNATLATNDDGMLHLRLYDAPQEGALPNTDTTNTTTNTYYPSSSQQLPLTSDALQMMPAIMFAAIGVLSILVARFMVRIR